MSDKLKSELIKVAEKKSLMTYPEVADLLNLDLGNPEHLYHTLTGIMQEVNDDCRGDNVPMLSSLIVKTRSRPYIPGDGFFELMKKWKFLKSGEKKDIFWAKMVRKCHDYEWEEN